MMIGKYLEQDQPDKERWLLSYADLLTLLLAFFIVMYSVSVVNEAKLNEFSASINNALVSDGARGLNVLDLTLPDITVKSGGRDWLEFTLDSEILFASGGANFGAAASVALDNMIQILAKSSGEIRVEGHTDNVPIGNPSYPSNWELSAVRAAAVVRFLESGGIPKNRLVAIGLGETQPIADNTTVDGRSQNRRVVFRVRESKLNFDQRGSLALVSKDRLALDQISPPEPPALSRELENELSEFKIEDVDPALLQQILNDLDTVEENP